MNRWLQKTITIAPVPRGFHLVTSRVLEAVPEIADVRVGMLHLNILHTSAGLTISENASSDVPGDMSSYFDRAVPDGSTYFRHVDEGPDDMSAHVKTSIVGSSLSVPIADGRLVLGTWQGLFLCEFRDRGSGRRIALTVFGDFL